MTEDERLSNEPVVHTESMSTGAIVRLVLAAIVLIAIVVLCARNTDSTNVDYLFGDADAPLFVVVAASAAAGVLLGVLASWRYHRRHRH